MVAKYGKLILDNLPFLSGILSGIFFYCIKMLEIDTFLPPQTQLLASIYSEVAGRCQMQVEFLLEFNLPHARLKLSKGGGYKSPKIKKKLLIDI